jgi:hypothetical protein
VLTVLQCPRCQDTGLWRVRLLRGPDEARQAVGGFAADDLTGLVPGGSGPVRTRSASSVRACAARRTRGHGSRRW